MKSEFNGITDNDNGTFTIIGLKGNVVVTKKDVEMITEVVETQMQDCVDEYMEQEKNGEWDEYDKLWHEYVEDLDERND